MYKVASASEYLVITGWGIPDIKLAKKSWVFPGQSCSVFDLSPVNYSFEVQAMSAEKLPFILPAVFTIGPRVDDEDALFKYAKLISSHDKHSNHTNELVQGIIEGETRVLAASMTMEEIFKGTKEFKQEVSGKVQLELNQFGLLIHNTNMKQLVDVRGHEYVSYLGQKTQMEAANQAKIDELQTEVEVESVKAVNLREAELQMEVERMNASTRTEKRRDEFLRKTSDEYVTKSATTTKYTVASASEYLVITGLGSPDVKLSKKSWVFPGQSCTVFDVSPVNYTFEVQAMSTDKLPFILPAVFTIGPRVDDEEALFKYAKLISSHDKHSNHTNELVQGIIEGETRVLAASMTMEAILKGTKEFKQVVFGKVQLELNQFGLLIYNANVKQLVDVRGHEYVSYLSQKTQMEAANKVKIDVAEARTKGEIGSKVRDICCIVKSLHDIYVVFVDMVDCISP